MVLEGIRVIDWSMFQVGPVAAAMLGDLGAEVIHIEERGRGDPIRGLNPLFGQSMELPGGRHTLFEHHDRNKKSVAIDLNRKRGREVMYRLVEKSDVFLTNFRRKAIAKFGLDYKALSQYNPKLIYAHASTFGPKGPDSETPGLDMTAQARSGIMAASGEPDMPPVMANLGIADQVAAIMLSWGVLAALVARERSGIGQEVVTSQLGSMITLQGIMVPVTLSQGRSIPAHQRDKALNPMYNYYQCKDGRWVALGVVQAERYWPTFCKALGMAELERDPRFEDTAKRQTNCQELISILDGIFSTRTYEEWAAAFRQADLLFSPVNTYPDLLSDPQVLENEYIVDFDHPVLGPIKFVGFPVQFSKTPASTIRQCAPECGQHTEEVLFEVCGYSWEEIGELREMEVI